MKGRMVRGGRSVARLVLVWVVSVVALLLLDRWLTGFALPSLWQAGVIALAFGVLSAVLWPLVMRIALPVALFTLGVGSFLLLGAALLALSFLVPGVVIADLGAAVVVAVAMSAVTGAGQQPARRRRATSCSSAAGPPQRRRSAPTTRPPGVLFLQIDGLGLRHRPARGPRRSTCPPRRLAARGQPHAHRLAHRLELADRRRASAASCTAPTTTSSASAGTRRTATTSWPAPHPEDAAEVERRALRRRAACSPCDGASRGNLFTGDAAARQPDDERRCRCSPGRGRRRGCAATASARATTPTSPTRYNAVRTLGSRHRRHRARGGRGRPAQRPARRAPARVAAAGLYPFARARRHGDRPRRRRLRAASRTCSPGARSSTPTSSATTRSPTTRASSAPTPRRAAQHRPADRPAVPGHRAGAAALPARRRCPTTGRPRARRSPTGSASRWRSWSGGCAAARRPSARRSGRPAGPDRDAGRSGRCSARPPAATGRSRGGCGRGASAPAATARAPRPATPGLVPRVAPGRGRRVSGHMAMVSFVEHARPGVAGDDRAGVPRPAARAGRPPRRRVRAGAQRGVRPGGARPRRRAPARDRRRPRRGPARALRAARRRARRAGSTASRTARTSIINSRYDPTIDEASPFEVHVGSHGGLGGPQAARLPAVPGRAARAGRDRRRGAAAPRCSGAG